MQYFSYTALFILCFNFSANAGLPRLSQKDLEAYSANIIQGRVISVKETIDVKYQQYTDYTYKVKMEVIKTMKGTYTPGEVVTLHYWSAGRRPDGMTGDMGLMENRTMGKSIRAGKIIRAYSYVGDEEENQLLNPNGFEVIEEPEEDYIIFLDIPKN